MVEMVVELLVVPARHLVGFNYLVAHLVRLWE